MDSLAAGAQRPDSSATTANLEAGNKEHVSVAQIDACEPTPFSDEDHEVHEIDEDSELSELDTEDFIDIDDEDLSLFEGTVEVESFENAAHEFSGPSEFRRARNFQFLR